MKVSWHTMKLRGCRGGRSSLVLRVICTASATKRSGRAPSTSPPRATLHSRRVGAHGYRCGRARMAPTCIFPAEPEEPWINRATSSFACRRNSPPWRSSRLYPLRLASQAISSPTSGRYLLFENGANKGAMDRGKAKTLAAPCYRCDAAFPRDRFERKPRPPMRMRWSVSYPGDWERWRP